MRQDQDAEEVVADAFARAYQTYTAHRAAGTPLAQPLVPFLYRTARNRAIDFYRARSRSLQVPLPAAEALPVPGGIADTAAERELLAMVRGCIAALPSPHREVYAHYYLEELRVEEVTVAVGLPYERVRAILKSAREQIGRLLAPHLLAEVLAELSAADRALLEPHYRPGRRGAATGQAADDAFAQARLRLVRRLLRWEVLFQRHPPEEYRALAAFARHRDPAQIAAAVTGVAPGTGFGCARLHRRGGRRAGESGARAARPAAQGRGAVSLAASSAANHAILPPKLLRNPFPEPPAPASAVVGASLHRR